MAVRRTRKNRQTFQKNYLRRFSPYPNRFSRRSCKRRTWCLMLAKMGTIFISRFPFRLVEREFWKLGEPKDRGRARFIHARSRGRKRSETIAGCSRQSDSIAAARSLQRRRSRLMLCRNRRNKPARFCKLVRRLLTIVPTSKTLRDHEPAAEY